jgi:hypothetical protein
LVLPRAGGCADAVVVVLGLMRVAFECMEPRVEAPVGGTEAAMSSGRTIKRAFAALECG